MTSSRDSTSETTIKIVGGGLPRTSTRSLQFALETLGYDPCYHVLSNVFPHADPVAKEWGKICLIADKAERQKRLAEMLAGHHAVVDAPSCFFLEDFLEMYPDVKIILGLRDNPQAWLKSFMNSVGTAFGHPLFYWIGYWAPETYGIFAMNNGYNSLFKKRLGIDIRDVRAYDLHNEWVRRVVPKERLLEHNAKDGWKPLSEFLDCPIPEEPYPFTNDAADMDTRVKHMKLNGLLRWAMVLSLLFAIGTILQHGMLSWRY